MFYLIFYWIFFFNSPKSAVETNVPTKRATRYITAFSITGTTKIPPWGAIKVHPNTMESAPAAAEPTIHAGNTCTGSDAANGIAPSVINASPMTKFVGPDCLSSFVNLFLNSSVARAIAQGGVIPPTITAAITS